MILGHQMLSLVSGACLSWLGVLDRQRIRTYRHVCTYLDDEMVLNLKPDITVTLHEQLVFRFEKMKGSSKKSTLLL
ncbi:hypothetical protein FA15DRAFT_663189 [Coprinopsis marcescibilis]|uniref:Uncharacterized protein n=1 Tax=Coprinopsis marcescibilis TaxID=230819 RepID=A0A5C3LDA1_COPMA|nr:hypothetical protein FA15DRAFT_663189 [Coprinopsis marcescibilis]